jgi:RNA 3'-terminal phosphate cyclase (ATP)
VSRALLVLDATHGEGGGQIVRTALGFAAALGRAVRLTGVRARRPRPGLQPQHLTVVRALATVSDAVVHGDALGSSDVTFLPRGVRAGEYRFDIGEIRGSAGSVSLLFEALLLPLATAVGPSRLTLVGGTHVPWSPPVPYVTDVFLPALAEVGVRASIRLRRYGWYPAGGGEIEAEIEPGVALRGFVTSPVSAVAVTGVSAVSRLPVTIAERQRRRAAERLAAAGIQPNIALAHDDQASSPGTLLFLCVRGRAGFSALGRRGLPAEDVADAAVDELLAWRASGAAVDTRLADQLVPFLARASGISSFSCPVLSSHLETVAWVARQFLPVSTELEPGAPPRVRVTPSRLTA